MLILFKVYPGEVLFCLVDCLWLFLSLESVVKLAIPNTTMVRNGLTDNTANDHLLMKNIKSI